MEAILKSLTDPSWWFNGLFFVIVAFLLPPLVRKVKLTLRRVARGWQAAGRKRVRRVRLNSGLLAYAIGRANVHYALFLSLAFGYMFVLVLLAAAHPNGKVPAVVPLALSFPVFIFEFAWIISDSFVKEVIKARRRFFVRSGRSEGADI